MKNIVKLLLALLFCTNLAHAQNVSAGDLAVVTFGDGKTFYAKVVSKPGDEVETRMLHSGSVYSFRGKTVTESEGAYQPGHVCKKITYHGGRKKDLWYVGNYIEVTFADGKPFFAQVKSMGNDGYTTTMLHSGNTYQFSGDGTVLSSNGLYKPGHKTRSVMLLTQR